MLISSTRRLPRLLLVFWGVYVLLWLGTLCHVATILIAVEAGNMTQVLASRAGNVGGMDTGGWGGVFPRSSSSLSLVILSCLYVLWIKASQPITYLELKVNYRAPNRSRTIPDMITVRFGRPA